MFELCLECVDPLEGVVVEFVMFFHAFEYLIRVDDVGVGLYIIVCPIDLLVLLY